MLNLILAKKSHYTVEFIDIMKIRLAVNEGLAFNHTLQTISGNSFISLSSVSESSCGATSLRSHVMYVALTLLFGLVQSHVSNLYNIKRFFSKEIQRQLGLQRYAPVWAMAHKL